MLNRANDVIARAEKLDLAVGQLQAFRGLVEDLDARCPISLPLLQKRLIEMVRSAILRSAIALATAVFDSKGRNRAGFGQVVELLNDTALVEFFLEKRGQDGRADMMRARLGEVCAGYLQVVAGATFQRVKRLRDDEIGHLLVRDQLGPPSEHSDIFELADEAQRLVVALHEGLGVPGAPHFITMSNDQPKPGDGLFWGTYLAGATARSTA
jgi:hypothetical protein